MSLKGRVYRKLPRSIRPVAKHLHQSYIFRKNFQEIGINSSYRTELEQSESGWQDAVEMYSSVFKIDINSPDSGNLPLENAFDLYSIIRDVNPNTVVETGVANGFSTLFVLAALYENGNGTLLSIDKPVYLDLTLEELQHSNRDLSGWKIPADKSPGWIIPNHLRNRWELFEGKSIDVLPNLDIENNIDIFIHDSEHTTTNMLFEYIVAYHNLHDGGYIISDDISHSEAFRIFCTERDIGSYGKISKDFGYIRK
jgi:predicted O-methyltransferase YrrM